MKAAQLKALCKERGLKVSGKKTELQERLREHFLVPPVPELEEDKELESMTEEDLRHALFGRGMTNVEGTREELLQRYKTDLEFVAQIKTATSPDGSAGYTAVSEALEDAAKRDGGLIAEVLDEVKAKTQIESKNIDLTVTSLGMSPIKFTAGGAPSVTADVLRTLAGDPFADPPRYGTVCCCGVAC